MGARVSHFSQTDSRGTRVPAGIRNSDQSRPSLFLSCPTVRQLPVVVNQCALSTMGTVELIQRAQDPHVTFGRV
jgi:hypothetical protein